MKIITTGTFVLGLLISLTLPCWARASTTYVCPTTFDKVGYSSGWAYQATDAIVASTYPVVCPVNQASSQCYTNGIAANSPANTFFKGYVQGSGYYCWYQGAVVIIQHLTNASSCKYFTGPLTGQPASTVCSSSSVTVCAVSCD